MSDARAGRGHVLHRALRKYGHAAFDWKVKAELPTLQEAQIAERILVAALQPAFNLTAGGDGTAGYSHSPETRAKISAALRASPRLKAANARIAASKRGSKMSESQRAALREGWKHRPPMTEATRAKLSAAHKGRRRTPEQIAKMLETRRANKCR